MGSTDRDLAGKGHQLDRKSAWSSADRAATGTDSLPATEGLANDDDRRNSHRPVVAMPAPCDPAEVGWSCGDEDVSQEVVVDDNQSHYAVARSGSSSSATKRRWSSADRASSRSFWREPRGEEDHGVAQVDDGHSAVSVGSPAVADRRRHGHLSVAGNQADRGAHPAPLRERSGYVAGQGVSAGGGVAGAGCGHIIQGARVKVRLGCVSDGDWCLPLCGGSLGVPRVGPRC